MLFQRECREAAVSRQKKVNIVGMIIAVVASMVLGYCYLNGLPAYYVFPFTLALVILGRWNRRQWMSEKEARAATGLIAE
jgi:hypothetical protein